MMIRQRLLASVFVCLVGLVSTRAGVAQQSTDETERGIPVGDPLVIAKCAGCHTRDANGIMQRISYMRTSPEVWEQILKRMIRLNGFVATPEETRHILRYLSANNGLSPAEARPDFWEAEHRLFRTQEEEAGVPAPLQRTCNYCHTIGRVLTQRRSAADYMKLANTHMALFPYAEVDPFRRSEPLLHAEDVPVTQTQVSLGQALATSGNGRDSNNEDNINYPAVAKKGKDAVDVAVEYLAKSQPLITPEWAAWKDSIKAPKLAGTWLVSAYQDGKGKIYGQMTVAATDSPDDFVTKTELHYPDGSVVTISGKGVVYAGYSWRGHATATPEAGKSDPAFPADTREAMLLSQDGNRFEGRWFWGGYQEFGIDVQATRLQKKPVLLGFDLFSVKSPSTAELHVHGANLPSKLQPKDFDLGKGVDVTEVVHSGPTDVVVKLAVAPGLTASLHAVSIGGITAPQTLAVYDKVGYIKVSPDANYARLGGVRLPKQYAQFKALAFANGEDGKPETADDIPLGPVPATWSLEEFYSTPKDDDIKYVGTIAADCGVFTPNLEGPNPNRRKQTNNLPTENWGDVWVDASYKSSDGTTLKARSYLVVVAPNYMHYDQPEVGQ